MSYQFIADRNASSIHVNLDASDGGAGPGQSEAVDLIERSQICVGPVVIWENYIITDTKNVLAGAGPRANNLALFLKKAADLNTAATFLAIFSVEEVAQEMDFVPQQMTRTLLRLNETAVPGKVIVFVTRGQEAARLFEGRNISVGRFHRQEAADPTDKLAKLSDAIAVGAPAGEAEHWDWADGSEWMDAIDELDAGDVASIVNNNWHRYPLARLKSALTILQGSFLSRSRAAEMLVASALARVNIVFLGPPGTAKSLMVRVFSQTLGVSSGNLPIRNEQQMIDEALQHAAEVKKAKEEGKGRVVQSRRIEGRRMFEYLLTRYTTPEELFGPAHIELMLSAGMHGRQTHGLLPQAEIAFLDEIFKANSAILNTLLSITNERLFYNLGQAFKVNLAFVVGASNETPAEDELGALFDRFPVRVPCRPVAQAYLKDVIKKAHGFDCARELHDNKNKIKRVACLNDLRLLAKIVQGGICGGTEAFGDSRFEEDFTKLLMAIRHDYGVSDRTPMQILRLCRALALLDSAGGDPQIKPDHLRAWGYVAPKFAAARDLQQLVSARIKQLPGNTGEELFDE